MVWKLDVPDQHSQEAKKRGFRSPNHKFKNLLLRFTEGNTAVNGPQCLIIQGINHYDGLPILLLLCQLAEKRAPFFGQGGNHLGRDLSDGSKT